MTMTDIERLNSALATLAAKGYEVSIDQDCSNCAMGTFNTDKFIYYTMQDVLNNTEGGMLMYGRTLHLGWGEDGLLAEMVTALHNQGFYVDLPESTSQKIGIR